MRDLVTLIDIGSTFTKVLVVDVRQAVCLGRCQVPTTVRQGVQEGVAHACRSLFARLGLNPCQMPFLACSSAAGGLRMVAVGLVPDLTAEAAKQAALGAGARVVGTLSYLLDDVSIAQIISWQPDLLLLAGGTDGGNERVLLANARRLAGAKLACPVIVAGNRVVARQAGVILRQAGIEVTVTENVMPSLGCLNVEPARKAVRDIFSARIVVAKGMAELQNDLAAPIIPTPAAVLQAVTLLAERSQAGVLAIDVGGATTDVHSVAEEHPTASGVIRRGLPEPFRKRNVEGDLGVRSSAGGVLSAMGGEALAKLAHTLAPEWPLTDFPPRVAQRENDPAFLRTDCPELLCDAALAAAAATTALRRHVGRRYVHPTPAGGRMVQTGKDLTGVSLVIGTGGVLAHSLLGPAILRSACHCHDESVLAPRNAELRLDKGYLLAAAGLLASLNEEAAFNLLVNGLVGKKSEG
ncbi:MAG TPA: hypothetical protein GXZ96_02850 [Firmicutes bacterium]|jgi:uncharacterized protein (TIGR01319 family)|nr:hypothetical protein [Bacillota bacterium]